MTKKEPIRYRHGDVNLTKIASLPEGLEEIKSDNGRTILAYGEVTGHAHALAASRTKQFKSQSGQEYLQVLEETDLLHEEHAPITLLPGIYEKRIAREYQDQGIVRKVVD